MEWSQPFLRRLISILLLLALGAPNVVAGVEDGRPPLTLSVSLYIVDESDAGADSRLSSRRDSSSLEQVAERMQAIWDQADIGLEIRTIARIEAPAGALRDLASGDTRAFLVGLGDGTIEVSGPGVVNGFYVSSLGRINGLTPLGTRLYFVTDEPSVHDERVSSHEIGHILGLHHDLSASTSLMFSGTNGIELADEEIVTSRYVLRGILDGLR